MRSQIYQFGDFSLNSLSKELNRNGEPVVLAASAFDCLVYLIEHRDRPVGKDELISAVWARADVSENLVAQTIVRLRRTIDDAHCEQSCIKTTVRVGYRWMLETRVTLQEELTVIAVTPTAASNFAIAAKNSRAPSDSNSFSRLGLRILMLAFLLALISASAYFFLRSPPPAGSKKNLYLSKSTAIVLPVEVTAPDDWKWLHLGLMDLISNELREAKVPTESSESVISLLNRPDSSDSMRRASFALVISPHVALLHNSWWVRLDAKGKDGQTWQAQASSNDVLSATRTASDILLAQLGFNDRSNWRQAFGKSTQAYLLRIQSARLANANDLARELIDKAPLELRQTLEFTYIKNNVLYCDTDNVDLCEQAMSSLLKQLPAKEQPVLRAKVLTFFWYIDFHKHQLAEGHAALDEAVQLLEGEKDTEALAQAYLDRSHLEYFQGQLEDSASDLGDARANFILAGDTVGQAKANFWTGMIAQHRGHFAEALPLMQQAYEQYERLGMRQLISTPLINLAFANKMQLLFPDELGITDRYWPLNRMRMTFSHTSVINDLILTRAIALADNGRRSEAIELLNRLLTQVGDKKSSDQYAEVRATLAKLALERDDADSALGWITKIMVDKNPPPDNDARISAEQWLILVDALQRTGKVQDLDHTITAMKAWVAHLPEKDDWIDIQLMRAEATQLWNEGHHDQSLEHFRDAMTLAEKLGVPDLVVAVGLPYEMELLNTGRVNQAIGLSGRFSPFWSKLDWRTAWAEASVFKAMGQQSAWEASRERAQHLAGDRTLPDGSHAFVY